MQQGNSKLGRMARRYIENADALYFSATSILEIEIKRMKTSMNLPASFYRDLQDQGYIELKPSGDHAEALRQHPALQFHDPFDRILVATAFAEGLPLLTSNQKLLSLGLPFVLDSQQ